MKKGEATRQQIIQQAAPLFNQRGFAGASMPAIWAMEYGASRADAVRRARVRRGAFI